MQGLVRRKGYGTNQLLRDGEHPRRYYDIRIWRNAEAAAQAESDREIDELRRSLGQHLQSTPLVDVAWAVEVGLAAAGPWQEQRAIEDRRGTADRRVQNIAFVGPRSPPRLRSADWSASGQRSGPIQHHRGGENSRATGRTRIFRISRSALPSRQLVDESSRAATSRTLPTA